MKRISVHGAFGLVALAVAAACAAQAWRLQQVRQVNAQIAAAAHNLGAQRSMADAAGAAASASAWASAGSAAISAAASAAALPLGRDAPREVRLAYATALARAGAFDAAFKTYSGLLEPGRSDEVSRQAQYNLGNMYLRQALQAGTPADAGPLVELAKQRYRDLLRAQPQDWDARYNLERALLAAPEDQQAQAEQANEPVERRNVMLRGMTPGDLP